MKINKLTAFLGLATFFSIFFCTVIISVDTFADVAGTGAVQNGVQCTDGSPYPGKDKYNCCAKGSACPHYTFGTNAQFVEEASRHASDEASTYSSEEYNQCAGGTHGVVWVHIDTNDGQATNWHPPSGTDNKAIGTGWLSPHTWANELKSQDWSTEWYNNSDLTNKTIGATHAWAISTYREYDIAFFCPENESQDGTTYVSRSMAIGTSGSDEASANTGFDHDKTATETLSAAAGETVTIKIKHDMKVESTGTEISASLPGISKWSVSKSGNNTQTRPSSGSTARSGTFKPTSNPGQATVAGEFTTATFTIPSGATQGQSWTICEQIRYDLKSKYDQNSNKNVKDGNATSWTKACIKVEVGDTTNDLCSRFFDQFAQHSLPKSNPDSWDGYDEAWSKVTKENNMNDISTWHDTIYVKPRENVRFLHCYYPYASVPKYSTYHPEHAYHCVSVDGSCTHDDYYATSAGDGRRIRIANRSFCELWARNSGYLFVPYKITDDDTSLCSGDLDVSRERPVQIISPSTDTSKYKCNSVSGGRAGFYQIVGLDPRSCTTDVNSTYDVGSTFEQWIEYSDIHTKDKRVPRDGNLSSRHSHNNYFELDINDDNGNREDTHAKVIVPYNFNTTTKITNFTGDHKYPGEPISFGYELKITPRENQEVTSSEYATLTPSETEVRLYQCTVSPSVGNPGDALAGGITDGSEPEGYIKGKLGGAGNVTCTYETVESGELNDQSTESGKTYSAGRTYNIPDVEDGTKYCAVLTVFPADSHNRPDETISSGMNTGASIGEGSFNKTRVSDIKCTTIAKKPNTQIFGAGVFAEGPITASASWKCVNWALSTEQNCTKTKFGSWTENELISNSAITKFGSGDGYGYGNWFRRGEYYAGGTASVQGSPGGNSSNDFRQASNLTIANNNASGGTAGYAAISAIDHNILDRILARYSSSQNYGGASDHTTYDISLGASDNGQTLVIYTGSTFRINHNIIVRDTDTYSAIEQVPQVLIIAPKIEISSSVTRVDAWLIATGGSINTCYEFSSGSTASDGACNQQLTLSGPIIAQKLYLNRTAGAGPGNQSINPAERFNLSASAYYWAYSQAEQLQQAFTTYTRELAPRY